jgi:hypothetical protein
MAGAFALNESRLYFTQPIFCKFYLTQPITIKGAKNGKIGS